MGGFALTDENVIAMIQREAKEWREYNFPDSNHIQHTLGVCEESGELAHCVLKMDQGIRGNEDHLDNAADAIGDIFIYLCGVATGLGLSMSDCITQTWDKVKRRDWIKYPDTGLPPIAEYDPILKEPAPNIFDRDDNPGSRFNPREEGNI